MSEPRIPSYAFLTDAPPLKQGGHGCHVLAWNWVEMMRSETRLVVTHQMNPGLDPERIERDLERPVEFYPDLCSYRWPSRLSATKGLLELWQFRRALPRISARILASGADRLFALFGGNGFFSQIARWTAAATRLPLDVYMVDDLEESHRLNKQPIAARWARSWEKKMLQKADRIFVISPGYSEHLKEKYSVASSWLPVQVRMDSIQYRQYVPKRPDVRFLTFVGGVNSLYSSSLRDCLQAIERWNSRASKPFEFRLQIMSYSTESQVRSELGSDASIEFLAFPDKALFERRLRESYAFFLPYSFRQDVRVMVSTSFPHKLSDYLPMGRPILVYGPEYASIPRHFRELNLPLCQTRQGELEAGLREIENQDSSSLIDQYEAVVRRCHSSDILRGVLALG